MKSRVLIMSRKIFSCLIIVFSAFFVCAREPKIGYLYPAGGQKGTVVRVIAGGQFLKNVSSVRLSGDGVTAKVIKHYKLRNNLNREQNILLRQSLGKALDKRIGELPEEVGERINIRRANMQKWRNKKKKEMYKNETVNAEKLEERLANAKMPEHPLLHDMDNKSFLELAHIGGSFFNRKWRKQRNPQLSELVELEITISTNAAQGNRELRLVTPRGMTAPIVFQINNLPEIKELEPNNEKANEKPKQLEQLPDKYIDRTVKLPVILNGQIMPGDVDRFRFKAVKGQNLIISTSARQLIPYLADAVPGWFQATLTLFNSKGKKLAFSDDYQFKPDPALYFDVPKTGIYEIEIRDAIYRGRQDFVYRISIDEAPFVTGLFPLGGKSGEKTVAKISGYNLQKTALVLDTTPGDEIIRQTFYRTEKQQSNPIVYAVDNLPECNELENANASNQLQHITLPKIINGRIDKPGDVDIFSFQGNSGDKIVAEVLARRLNSPLDSLLRLTDSSGKVIKWNDDYIVKDNYLHKSTTGLITHHSDSYLTAEFPETGTYNLQITDAGNNGGEKFAYRLRVSAPQPDFTLFAAPSSINIKSGTTVPVTVYAIRKQGFTGPIIVTANNSEIDVKVAGGIIPSGCDKLRMTLTAQQGEYNQSASLRIVGSAEINGRKVLRDAIPADNAMQAFLYCHLVPAKELLLFTRKSRWNIPTFRLTNETPVKVSKGGIANLHFESSRRLSRVPQSKIELDSPPEGITIKKLEKNPDGINIQLQIDKNALNVGYKDNLIFAAYRDTGPRRKKDKKTKRKIKFRVETLPAVPIEIVK